MNTWGEMLFFSSKEKQILHLEKGKMKNKIWKKFCLNTCETNKQTNTVILNMPI